MRMFSRKIGAATMVSLLVIGGMTAGCGGGGSSSGNSQTSTQTRQVALAAVKDSRSKVASRIQQALSSFGAVGGPSRKIKTSRQFSGPQYDESTGLYYTVSSDSDTSFVIHYYTDQTGSTSAGTTTMTIGADGSFRFVFDVRAGFDPLTGTMQFTPDSGSSTTGTLAANITTPGTNENVTMNVHIAADESFMGSLSYKDSTGTLTLNNLTYSPTGDLASDLVLTDTTGTINGHITQQSSGAGTLSFKDTTGETYLAVYDAEGAGYLQYPDGHKENISDFDTA